MITNVVAARNICLKLLTQFKKTLRLSVKSVKNYVTDSYLIGLYLYGTVGVDWNTDPSKVSDSMKAKAKKASKRKVSF